MFACPVSLLLCGVAHRRRPLIVLECWPCHGWLHDCVPQSFCLLGKVELPFVFWAKWNFHSKDEECVFSSFPQCHKKCAEHVYEVENSVVTFNLPMFWLRYPARGVSALLVERLPTCLHHHQFCFRPQRVNSQNKLVLCANTTAESMIGSYHGLVSNTMQCQPCGHGT